MRFQEQLQAISQASIHDDASWSEFCDFVAAVGASELVNTPVMTASQRIQGKPDELIQNIYRIRKAGVCAIQTCHFDMTCLTQPSNYFASIVSTLKICGAHQTAEAVKIAAKKYWVEVERFFQQAQAADSVDQAHQESKRVLHSLEQAEVESSDVDDVADLPLYVEQELLRQESTKRILRTAGVISLAFALLSILNR